MPLIDPVLLKARLGLLAGRFDVDACELCDSTSSELARRAELGAPAGTVLVADRQSAGRGRRGRQWLSSPEASLTFSVLWRFTGSPARLAGLSLAVGVALARAVDNLGASGVCLKWPNDVLLRQGDAYAKLAGILIELSSDRRGTQAVIGIGLNLLPPAGDLPQPAAGLSQALSTPAERHVVLAAILSALAGVLDAFAAEGFSAIKGEWQQRHAWQGEAVSVLGEGEPPLPGRCLGADDDGALLLETAAGIQRIFSGDVSLRRVASALGARCEASTPGVRRAASTPVARPEGSALGAPPAGSVPEDTPA
ncbi:MAG: biotin--[acetyl-CoA-carboxylase] ligase [Azonexus sp.]